MGGMYVRGKDDSSTSVVCLTRRRHCHDKCGGEVVYSIQDIRQLLRVQPEDVKRWLTGGSIFCVLERRLYFLCSLCPHCHHTSRSVV
jgi:hypothetical protein